MCLRTFTTGLTCLLGWAICHPHHVLYPGNTELTQLLPGPHFTVSPGLCPRAPSARAPPCACFPLRAGAAVLFLGATPPPPAPLPSLTPQRLGPWFHSCVSTTAWPFGVSVGTADPTPRSRVCRVLSAGAWCQARCPAQAGPLDTLVARPCPVSTGTDLRGPSQFPKVSLFLGSIVWN